MKSFRMYHETPSNYFSRRWRALTIKLMIMLMINGCIAIGYWVENNYQSPETTEQVDSNQ